MCVCGGRGACVCVRVCVCVRTCVPVSARAVMARVRRSGRTADRCAEGDLQPPLRVLTPPHTVSPPLPRA